LRGVPLGPGVQHKWQHKRTVRLRRDFLPERLLHVDRDVPTLCVAVRQVVRDGWRRVHAVRVWAGVQHHDRGVHLRRDFLPDGLL
jgi:hypothetical protein